MAVDSTKWSGEGEFTQVLVDCLEGMDDVALITVENAPPTRSDADYNFIANEIFLTFAVKERRVATRHLGFIPGSRQVAEKLQTLTGLSLALTGLEAIGPPDYEDEGMLQYLRTQRIIPPYQTKGYKLIELVRLYEAGTPSRA